MIKGTIPGIRSGPVTPADTREHDRPDEVGEHVAPAEVGEPVDPAEVGDPVDPAEAGEPVAAPGPDAIPTDTQKGATMYAESREASSESECLDK